MNIASFSKLFIFSLFFLFYAPSSILTELPNLLTSPIGNEIVLSDSKDFATQQFSDPWDMSNQEDIGVLTRGFSNTYFNDGKWYGKITGENGGYLWLLFGGFPGSYPNGREGIINKINISYYKRFIIRMNVEKNTNSRLRLFRDQSMKNFNVLKFNATPGWSIYTIDIPGDLNGFLTGLRFDPDNKPNNNVIIDWIRLVPRDNVESTINWNNNTANQQNIEIFLDNDNSGYNGDFLVKDNSLPGSNEFNYDFSGLFPGIYFAYLRDENSQYSNYAAPFKINQAPVFEIIDPDKTGGQDWAAVNLRNRWDFNRFSDMSSYKNITRKSISNQVFSAINTTDDPILLMKTGGKKINADRYRYLTIRYKYDGVFDLYRGTMARFIWQSEGREWSTSDDIVTYDSGWRTYTIDLKKIKLNGGSYGWHGKIVNFRFDPNEDRLKRRFYIDYIKLSAEDRLVSSFDIKYKHYDPDSKSNYLKLYWDLDRVFGNGNEFLITKKYIGNGIDSYRWRPRRSLRRRVWIYAQVSDGVNTRGSYSTGTLRVHL